MGADLCGYIMVGPKRLTRKRVKAAIAHLDRLGEQAEAEETEQEPLRGVIRSACCDGFCEEAADFLSWFSDLPSSVLTDFVAMWNDGGHRDQMGRYVPGDPTRMIVVVGESTWGDGPEDGSAWYLAEAMDHLGLFEILGIE